MKKLSKTNLTLVVTCVSVVFFIATLFLYHKLAFVPIKHKMSPSELVNAIATRAGRFGIKGPFPSSEQIEIGRKELDTYNYCKKDSDCAAIMGPENCMLVNKSEVESWKSTNFSDVGTYCSNSQMGGVLVCGVQGKCGIKLTSPNINIDLGGGGMPGHLSIISPADISQDPILLGASHNVFIGRVLNQSGTKALGSSPETQFQVEVIDNIKGDLKGTVTVNQFGGYQNGTLVTVEDETNGTNEPYLLEPGQTYLFATRYLEGENWYTVLSSSYGKKLLSKDENASIAQLKTLALNDERVKALTAAYPNEKLLDADIQHQNTRNNYKEYEAKIQAEQNTPPKTVEQVPPQEVAPIATTTATPPETVTTTEVATITATTTAEENL